MNIFDILHLFWKIKNSNVYFKLNKLLAKILLVSLYPLKDNRIMTALHIFVTLHSLSE